MIVQHTGESGTLAVHAVCDGCAVALQESNDKTREDALPVDMVVISESGRHLWSLCGRCNSAVGEPGLRL